MTPNGLGVGCKTPVCGLKLKCGRKNLIMCNHDVIKGRCSVGYLSRDMIVFFFCRSVFQLE